MAITAFISYTSTKDFYGHITSFHQALEYGLRIISNQDVSVYFDKEKIAVGDKWSDNLLNGLQEARVLLIMLNPGWLSSEWCRKEYLKFKEFHGENAKIIPIIWAETQIADAPNDEAKQILAELKTYQYKDWREFVFDQNYAGNPKLLQNMSEIAHSIKKILKTSES